MFQKPRLEENNFSVNPESKLRNRIIYFFLTLLVISLGLFTRKIAYQLPEMINLYLGDALWALMIFLATGFIFNKIKTLSALTIALCFCFLIEVSQLYHAAWIDAIRQTTLGGLILGFGFLWSDMLAYTVGVVFGAMLEKLFLRR